MRTNERLKIEKIGVGRPLFGPAIISEVELENKPLELDLKRYTIIEKEFKTLKKEFELD